MKKVLWVISVISIILVVHFIANFIFGKFIKNKVRKRKETIFLVIINLIKYIGLVVGLFVILTIFGIDPASVLAGAGVLGILLGFGMQKLVQDIVNGFFLIFENQYVAGEYVSINGVSGEVIELGLKTTKILTYKGEVHFFANGDIKAVINYTRNSSLGIVEIPILYNNDINIVYSVINETLSKYYNDSLIEKPKIQGITGCNEISYTIRIVCLTKPYEHFKIERAIREIVILSLKENNINFLF